MRSSSFAFTQKSRLGLTMRARSLVRHRVGRGVFLRTVFVPCPLFLAPPLPFLLAPLLRATPNLKWFAHSQMTTSISTLACHLILLGRIKTLSKSWIASACILPVVLAAFVIGAGASPISPFFYRSSSRGESEYWWTHCAFFWCLCSHNPGPRRLQP